MIKQNADIAYINLLDKILTEGRSRGDRTGTGTWSIFSHTLEIDMTQGFPLLTTKKMFTKGIIHELIWFLNGDTNIKYLVENGVNIWNADAYREYKKYAENLEEPDYFVHVDDPNQNCTRIMTMDEFVEAIKRDESFAQRFGDLGPVYGKQWRKWKTFADGTPNPDKPTDSVKYIDQIQQVLDLLENNPESRRIIVSAWNAGQIDKMALPPCHWAFELYVEDIELEQKWAWIRDNAMEKYHSIYTSNLDEVQLTHNEIEKHFPECPEKMLSLKWHQRSVDTFLGLPFNIASYAILLHMFAQRIGYWRSCLYLKLNSKTKLKNKNK